MTLLRPRPPAAPELLALLEEYTGARSPVRIRAWDGSEAGPRSAPLVVLRSRRALRRLLWRPDELGLARAYVTGDLDVDGDLRDGLRSVRAAASSRLPAPGWQQRLAAARRLGRLGALGPRPATPGGEIRLRGERHSRGRDRAAISHHYDLPPAFYALLLDPHMAYSCGYWSRPPGEHGYGLQEAQRDKLELVCRKLGLRPGSRLLDVGCGWGALALYAAEQHQVRVVAVTLAAEQAEYVREQVRRRRLEDHVEVRLCDYRDIPGDRYDAVASLEMGEHVGDFEYAGFVQTLRRLLRPQGRLLIQQMSRSSAPGSRPGGGAFIESYIAADMHMRPVGETLTELERAGLEIRSVEAMREHYVRTVDAWARTLEDRWEEVVALVGREAARTWRLYLAGGGLAFEERRMGVDQILAVRPDDDGHSGLSGTLRDWYQECTP